MPDVFRFLWTVSQHAGVDLWVGLHIVDAVGVGIIHDSDWYINAVSWSSNMAYRGIKGSDPFASKTTRNERFAQMSKQEQLIEQKKREIQAKLEDQKKKETEEALKKLQGVSGNSRCSGNRSNSQIGQHKGGRKPFWKRYVAIIASFPCGLDHKSVHVASIFYGYVRYYKSYVVLNGTFFCSIIYEQEHLREI
jgi:hypothetical protein